MLSAVAEVSLRRRSASVGRGWSRGPEERQAAVLPRNQGKARRPTQARKRGREGPVRIEKRARQWKRPVALIQAPRPAPGISKKTRPKNGDKEG